MAIENATWVDEDLVGRILRIADKDDSIKVSNLKLNRATAPGNSFTSDIHRVMVTVSKIQDGIEVSEEVSLVFKIAREIEYIERLIGETDMFALEITALLNILPKMNEILKPLQTTLSPRCFYGSTEKPIYIVLEDLAQKGFRMADGQQGLDLAHCLIAIRNLAKFHASSVVLKEKEPDIFVTQDKSMYFDDPSGVIETYFHQAMRSFVHESSKWPELNPGYVRIFKKISKLPDVIYQKGCKAAEFDEDSFNAFTHGDCWVNNMLFCYDDDGNVCDQIFVDFTMGTYGAVAIDILHFLATSPSQKVRDNHRELLIREYYVTLTEAMALFKCSTKVPTFSQIQEDLNKRVWLEIIPLFAVVPHHFKDKSIKVNANGVIDEGHEVVDTSGMRNEQYRKLMLKLLPELDSRGLLDQ